MQHRELVAQHEDLDIFGTIRAASQHQQVDHEPDKTVEVGHAPILAASEPRRSRQRETQVTTPGEFFGTHTREMHTARVEFDEEQHVVPTQHDGVDTEEVTGDDPSRLRA